MTKNVCDDHLFILKVLYADEGILIEGSRSNSVLAVFRELSGIPLFVCFGDCGLRKQNRCSIGLYIVCLCGFEGTFLVF